MNLSLLVLKIGLVFGGLFWSIFFMNAVKGSRKANIILWSLFGIVVAYLTAAIYWCLIGPLFYSEARLLEHDNLFTIALQHWWLPTLSFLLYTVFNIVRAEWGQSIISRYLRLPGR
jgi:hypothetical protein